MVRMGDNMHQVPPGPRQYQKLVCSQGCWGCCVPAHGGLRVCMWTMLRKSLLQEDPEAPGFILSPSCPVQAGRRCPPPLKCACAVALPGCLPQQAGEEGEIKGGFQQPPFSCLEVSLVIAVRNPYTISASSEPWMTPNGVRSKAWMEQGGLERLPSILVGTDELSVLLYFWE